MWDALGSMLPYAVGLLVSPLPVAAVIMLLVSAGGVRKATVFETTWLIVSFALVVAVAAVVRQTPPRTRGETPVWEGVLVLVLGLVMLGIAVLVALAWSRQRGQAGEIKAPAWLRALDSMSVMKIAVLAGVLIIANPVNASMLIAAGVELGQHRLAVGRDLLPAALFTVIGSLTMVAPYAITLAAGREAGFLPRARRWLLRHNNALTFWMTLAFGLLFLSKGLRALM
ncbi:GAP family protein [Glycomyces tenuis]|uniref:GAP family protein n=1 Tax=Glycomyces tenuis TaxID=58116 RepID=UPI0004239D9F|nr:GAP family protein [Glycomyces tenuis]